MNISLMPLSLFVGAVCGGLSMLTLRNPVISIVVAVGVTLLTEGLLRAQNKS